MTSKSVPSSQAAQGLRCLRTSFISPNQQMGKTSALLVDVCLGILGHHVARDVTRQRAGGVAVEHVAAA